MNRTALALAIALTAAAGVIPGSPIARDAHAAGIQRCLAPVPDRPQCAYRYSPGCDAPAAYCGHHASPESGR